MNLCTVCGEDFGSVSAFDKHRVGTFDYTFTQGLDMDPPRENGRRCLGVDEFEAKGFVRNARGTWSDAKKLESARRAFHPSRT